MNRPPINDSELESLSLRLGELATGYSVFDTANTPILSRWRVRERSLVRVPPHVERSTHSCRGFLSLNRARAHVVTMTREMVKRLYPAGDTGAADLTRACAHCALLTDVVQLCTLPHTIRTPTSWAFSKEIAQQVLDSQPAIKSLAEQIVNRLRELGLLRKEPIARKDRVSLQQVASAFQEVLKTNDVIASGIRVLESRLRGLEVSMNAQFEALGKRLPN